LKGFEFFMTDKLIKTPPEIVPADNLAAWLADPRLDKYLGRRPVFKLAVLAAVFGGTETLAGLARRHGVSPAAAGKHAKAARRIFGAD
jgi:hypothetical protein